MLLILTQGSAESLRWSKVINYCIDSDSSLKFFHIGEGAEVDMDFGRFLYNERDGLSLDDYSFKGHLVSYYEHLDRELLHFIDMSSRLGYPRWLRKRYSSLPFHEYINLFHILIDYFADLLIEKKIKIVIFPTAPALGADYALYVAADKLGIQIYVFVTSVFPDRSFCAPKLEDLGVTRGEQNSDSIDIDVRTDFKFKWYYMNKSVKRKLMPVVLKPFLRLIKDTLSSAWTGKISSQCILLLSDLIMSIRNKQFRNKMHGSFIISETTLDYSANYIYFPLHMQPEVTTSAFGRGYFDQLRAIEKLATKLPEGWLIYVKEHPSQSTAFMRGALFYERIKQISNVRLISPDVATSKLSKYAKVVAVITGTAGYEAACGGVPVIYFGAAWYRELPGVYPFSDEIDIEAIVSGYQYRKDDFATALGDIVKSAYYVISYDTLLSEKHSEEESIARIGCFVRKVVGQS